MADAHRNFRIRRVNTVAGEFKAIVVPPGEFSRVVIENGDAADAVFRTDLDDGMTEKTVPQSMELDIWARENCFLEGQTVGYFKTTNSSVAICSFTR